MADSPLCEEQRSRRRGLSASLACVLLLLSGGCAFWHRQPKKAPAVGTDLVAIEREYTRARFDDVWHAVRRVLKDGPYEVDLIDKKGRFVAYTPAVRLSHIWRWRHRRTKIEIRLVPLGSQGCAMSVVTVVQEYKVSLLKQYRWVDLPRGDSELAKKLVDEIDAELVRRLAPAGG